jgi:hypothetical protein
MKSPVVAAAVLCAFGFVTSCSSQNASSLGTMATSAPPVAEVPTLPPDFRVSMWRTACWGTCPVYEVSVDASGHVEYDGQSHVAAYGRSEWTIPASSVAKLAAKCEELGFFDLQEHCTAVIYDSSKVGIEVVRNGATKVLCRDLACGLFRHDGAEVHLALDSLTDSIDELLETSSRVGTDAGK